MLRRLYYFIAGNPDLFSFEHRILNITCFTGTFFTTLGFTLNFSLDLNWVVIITSIGGILYGAGQYYLSRIRGLFNYIFIDAYVVFANVLLGLTYFFNGGSGGTIFYMLLVNYFIFMLISKQSQQARISIFFIATTILLIYLEAKHPEWVIPYSNNEQRIFDHATLLIYSLLFAGLIVRLFRKDYDNEKAIIEAQKRELDDLYQKSSEKNQYIESLIRELHHRVKNNLQVVSSLLALQSKRLDDERARTALEDGRTRVDAIAMIHQKLYMNHELAAVNMKEYLEHLCSSLAQSYGFSSSVISTQVNINREMLDIDRAVSIGLIVNELVTNSFKHAFQNVSEPKLFIRLHQLPDALELEVGDNGKGMSPGEVYKNSFGMKLVHTLVQQLGASIQVENQQGTFSRIKMKAGV